MHVTNALEQDSTGIHTSRKKAIQLPPSPCAAVWIFGFRWEHEERSTNTEKHAVLLGTPFVELNDTFAEQQDKNPTA